MQRTSIPWFLWIPYYILSWQYVITDLNCYWGKFVFPPFMEWVEISFSKSLSSFFMLSPFMKREDNIRAKRMHHFCDYFGLSKYVCMLLQRVPISRMNLYEEYGHWRINFWLAQPSSAIWRSLDQKNVGCPMQMILKCRYAGFIYLYKYYRNVSLTPYSLA